MSRSDEIMNYEQSLNNLNQEETKIVDIDKITPPDYFSLRKIKDLLSRNEEEYEFKAQRQILEPLVRFNTPNKKGYILKGTIKKEKVLAYFKFFSKYKRTSWNFDFAKNIFVPK